MLRVVHGESTHSFCRAPSRLSEHHSRRRVQTYEGSLGLETSPRLISEDSRNIWSDRSASVCIQADIPGSTVFHLETRPPDRSNRCLPTKIESVSGICKSTMGVNCSNTIRSSVPEGRCGFDSSSMENTGMVSNVVVISGWYPYRLPVHREVVWQVHPVPSLFQGDTIQLAAWPILGKAAKRENFLSKLQASSWHHGDPSRTQTTTHSFTSGSAGVIQGIEIPFLVQ